jgi:UDP-N-acetylmuramoyl-tripeptide--D-alanyl-D-alanine ligase
MNEFVHELGASIDPVAPGRSTALRESASVKVLPMDAARAMRASEIGRATQAAPYRCFAIDSRKIDGDRPTLFLALKGPNHDGHDFVGAAVAAGAAGVVVSREGALAGIEVPAFLVADTSRALQDLAHSVRSRFACIVGITGSAGKTTAKEMTAAVLGARRPTGRTAGNLNNTFGLPLTLLNQPEDAQAVVLEMGMSTPGEIARLAEIADPDVGVILNVREVHLGNFASIDEIARAKGELFRGMRAGAIAVYNAADARVRLLAEAFPGPRISFALGAPADVIGRDVEDDIVRGVRFRMTADGADHDVRLSMFGAHNVENALAALAVARALGDDMGGALRALSAVRPATMRGEVLRLGGDIVLVDDTYNSNPSAMASVLGSLAATSWPGRKVLVAGDMLELGSRAAEFHRQVGEQAARAGVGLLVAVGPLAEETVSGASRQGLTVTRGYPDSAQAAAGAGSWLAPGDLAVVKGSRGLVMEKVVAAAKAAFGDGRAD